MEKVDIKVKKKQESKMVVVMMTKGSRWRMRAGRGGQRGETVETKAGWPPPEHTYSLQRRRESS